MQFLNRMHLKMRVWFLMDKILSKSIDFQHVRGGNDLKNSIKVLVSLTLPCTSSLSQNLGLQNPI